jgi:hypothetical protein
VLKKSEATTAAAAACGIAASISPPPAAATTAEGCAAGYLQGGRFSTMQPCCCADTHGKVKDADPLEQKRELRSRVASITALDRRGRRSCRCVAVGFPFCKYLSRLARLAFIHPSHYTAHAAFGDFHCLLDHFESAPASSLPVPTAGEYCES